MRLTMMVGALLVLALSAPVAAAQNRTATLRASATIVGGPGSDVLAARAVMPDVASPTLSVADVAMVGQAWRITGARGQPLSILVESDRGPAGTEAQAVAICEVVGTVAEHCREHRIPTARVTAAGLRGDVMVRVGAVPRTRGAETPAAPVRVTIAYIS